MVIMGYLICEKCEGYYELQEKENPEDFKSCECGGKLKFVLNLIDFYGETLDESLKTKDIDKSSASESVIPKYATSKLINLKAIFLGCVIWVMIDSLLYRVSIYNLDGLAVVSLVSAQFVSGIVAGYVSGKEVKAGILTGFIVGLFFAVLLSIKYYPSIILIAVLILSALFASIGGVLGVFIYQKTSKTKEKEIDKTTKTTESPDNAKLTTKKEEWPKNLAVWLAGLGVLFLFLYFPIFGGILIIFALIIYASKSFMAIYAFVGAYLGYTLIQTSFGILNLFYANMSIYEREDMYSFVALTLLNLAISGYVLYRTRKLDLDK